MHRRDIERRHDCRSKHVPERIEGINGLCAVNPARCRQQSGECVGAAVDSIGGREAAGMVDIVGGFVLVVKCEMGRAEKHGNRSLIYCSENPG